jgi:RluA family pseudouridine synthase
MMLVLNKPAGVAVHPGRGKGENLQPFFEGLRFGLPQEPALSHRLDAATSGCLVLGRHRQALKQLGDLFAKGHITKTYWAIVEGHPPEDAGVIDLPLAKQSTHKANWWMKVDENGQTAVTHYKIMEVQGERTWLELTPHTGRTHQLRVHCAAIGCPIVGDRIYGHTKTDEPLKLHARSLQIPLYPKKEPIDVVAEVPEGFF